MYMYVVGLMESVPPEMIGVSLTLSLSPGLQQILSKRTSRRFIAGRIVPDAEVKLNFLLSKVLLSLIT